MTIVSVESERFETMEKVADLMFHGNTETQIAKQLNIPRKEVIRLQEDYRTALANDSEARDMARDYLHQMVKHYDSLIKKFYELVEEIDALSFNHQVAGQKNAALKAIADLEAKRLDALQKAGLLENSELGDELAEAEEKRQIIIDILEHDLCPACKRVTASKIMQLTGKVVDLETIEVEVVG